MCWPSNAGQVWSRNKWIITLNLGILLLRIHFQRGIRSGHQKDFTKKILSKSLLVTLGNEKLHLNALMFLLLSPRVQLKFFSSPYQRIKTRFVITVLLLAKHNQGL